MMLQKFEPYPKMKNSGIEWIGEIPEHWEFKRLKFATILRTEKINGNANNLPYVGLENVESGTSKLIDINVQMEEADSKKFNKDDVLFGKLRPYLSKVHLANFFGRCSGEFLVLISIDYNPIFLQYLLISDGCIKTVDSSTYGAKMPRAEWSFIGNMRVPIPEINEQKSISKFLEFETKKIDSQVQRNQKLIELLKEKRQVVINQAVTKGLDPTVPMKDSGVEWIGKIPKHWKTEPIKWMLDSHKQGFYTEEEYVDDGVKLIRITDIDDFANITYDEAPQVLISDKDKNIFSVKHNDFLFARSGTIGRFGIAKYPPTSVFASYLIRFRFTRYQHNFLKFVFQARYFQESLLISLHGGANKNIHAENIKEIIITFPDSQNEQEKISEFLDKETFKIDNLKLKTETQIEKLHEYRQSLISAVVTGKIDVRNLTKIITH